jgi:hypothetical protein
MLKFSTHVTLVEDGGWSVRIRTPKGLVDLGDALKTYRCQQNTSGVKLAEIVVTTLGLVVSKGRSGSLRERSGRSLPLITLKDFLAKTAGPCTACKGKGCKTCNGLGVA